MLKKIEGIVLRTIKYSDNSLIIQLFTREHGRISCIAKGVHNKKTKFAPSFFQPLTIFNAEIIFNNKKDISIIKEVNIENSLDKIRDDYYKLTVVMFLSEVLNKTIKYQNTDEKLFDYVKEMIYKFENDSNSSANFHLYFLLGMTHFLGFYPVNNFDSNKIFFDLLNAQFVNNYAESQTVDKEFSALISQIMKIKNNEWWSLNLTSFQRHKLIEILLNYYTLHTGINIKTKSLDVLTDVFS
ncbi:MAG: DNA repair protein RecO [Bacteroidetes bacterium GWA2_32_17]|nr:MAG: DNA repair protein RecO [Bacteroidetes bacterium GWA2_32_17]